MKTTKIAAIGAASVFAVVVLILAYPAMAAIQTSSTSIIPSPSTLSAGQTITFTSTAGTWHLISSSTTAKVTTGSASGGAVLTVTGAYKAGYTLSLTSGTLSINGSSYTFASGSALMGPKQAHLIGQGTFAAVTLGSFLFAAGAHANFQGQTYNTLRFDVQANGEEYAVVLLVTAQVP